MYKLFVTYSFPSKEQRDGFYENVIDDGIDKISLKEEGCLRYEYELSDDDCLLLLHEEWETKRHQEQHMNQPTIGFLKGYKMRFQAETNVEVLEEADDYEECRDDIIAEINTICGQLGDDVLRNLRDELKKLV